MSISGFKRKNPFRAKLAIAITANFVNRNTMDDVKVEEIPGIFSFMNPEFFGELKGRGFDLENFVYFKDETHYFVMTVKKPSLLEKGVLKQVGLRSGKLTIKSINLYEGIYIR